MTKARAARRPAWYLQIHHTTWVFWGYGPRGSVVHMDPAAIELGYGLDPLPFELPAPSTNLPAPREYDRRVGYGWRWNNTQGAGHDWKSAASVEDAVRQARRSLEHMRHDTRKIFATAIDDVRIDE